MNDDTKCIGISICGGPCDESCPVIRNEQAEKQGSCKEGEIDE